MPGILLIVGHVAVILLVDNNIMIACKLLRGSVCEQSCKGALIGDRFIVLHFITHGGTSMTLVALPPLRERSYRQCPHCREYSLDISVVVPHSLSVLCIPSAIPIVCTPYLTTATQEQSVIAIKVFGSMWIHLI